MLQANRNLLEVGALVEEAAQRRGGVFRSDLVALTPATPTVARMFAMNFETWRRRPAVLQSASPVELDEIAVGLTDIANSEAPRAPITWQLRQLSLTSAEDPPQPFAEAADVSGLVNVGETKILLDDLSGPEIAGFLQEHIEEMKAVTPPGSKHALDLDGLRSPSVRFWTVVADGRIVGCGAIQRLDDHHGEIKSMRVAPACRRTGVASMLLTYLVAEAERMGFLRLSLETGASEFFERARRLYRKYGFELCGPFADYILDPNSVFMTKVL